MEVVIVLATALGPVRVPKLVGGAERAVPYTVIGDCWHLITAPQRGQGGAGHSASCLPVQLAKLSDDFYLTENVVWMVEHCAWAGGPFICLPLLVNSWYLSSHNDNKTNALGTRLPFDLLISVSI